MDLDMRILVVDDFATMRRILKESLRQLGFKNIIEAADGKAAADTLEKEDIGLILCDLNMPKMTGLQLLESLRSHQTPKDIPFIMITGLGQKEVVLEAVRAGVSNYILKPFTPETLLAKIEAVLR